MTREETKSRLQTLLEEGTQGKDGDTFFFEVVDTCCELIAETFSVCQHDVAILLLNPRSYKTLVFVAPKALRRGNIIPLTNQDSIAARAVTHRKANINNRVAETKHFRVYEIMVPNMPQTIQKMMTTFLLRDNRISGVVQISRKGDTPDEAGADFTPEDIHRLNELLQDLTPSILSARDLASRL